MAWVDWLYQQLVDPLSIETLPHLSVLKVTILFLLFFEIKTLKKKKNKQTLM